ncbi:MAG: hypothetical protein HY696_00435 [Deltaproteobacteria bacterium]|nr:hypothetical protein [Deltaproteobacteria bacterium]
MRSMSRIVLSLCCAGVLIGGAACQKKTAGDAGTAKQTAQCTSHDQCGETKICDRGLCIEVVPCQAASDCAAGMVCAEVTKVCCHADPELCI